MSAETAIESDYRLLLRHCTPVEVVSWRETDLAWGETAPRWSSKDILPEQCWYNAHLMAERYPGRVEYVEGLIVFDDAIVEHAWNSIDGKHFDITWECHLPHGLRLIHHQLLSGHLCDLKTQGYRFMPEVMTMLEQYRRGLNRPAS